MGYLYDWACEQDASVELEPARCVGRATVHAGVKTVIRDHDKIVPLSHRGFLGV